MQWEMLPSPNFKQAVIDAQKICVLTMGVLEKHGEHLCLGTDYLTAHRIGCLAGERENVMVFPPFYFGQIYEARCFPGCVTLEPSLTLQVIQGVCDEIGRNGFRKIVIYNGHGGNDFMLNYFAQTQLWKQKPYTVYVQEKWIPDPELWKQWLAIREAKDTGGHACETETSYTMCDYPQGVRMDQIAEPTHSLDRLKAFETDGFLGIKWYSKYPDHYAGDARTANPEKGKIWQEILVKGLADFIKRVKADEVAPALEKEFFEREKSIRNFEK
ncbi:creatininase family protein [Candidatus Sumerlaeota bacterium]|nr:creatininase family protein [Candidatus Sumerlaeales bacterium]NLD61683.1 creatininase family protein [Candidatus Sumerlaeota bacterium]